MRTRFANWFMAVIFLLLAIALLNLDVIHGGQYRKLSDRNCIRLLPQEGGRGKIFDRKGKVIVGNRLCYDVAIVPQDSIQSEKAILALSKLLMKDAGELRRNFRGRFIGNFAPVAIVKDIEKSQAIAVEGLRLDFPNIIIQSRPVRDYPYGSLACHVLGYLNEIDRSRLTKLEDYGYQTRDIVGFGGIEEKYDYYLRSERGGQSLEVDHRGRFVRILGVKPSRDGKDMQLTLDLDIQQIVENKLAGRWGSVIIMDPFSGEVIAMASSPGFKPNAFIKKSRSLQGLFNDSEAPLLNRSISGLYPPGSVFKLVVASGALDTKKMNASKTYSCPGSLRIGGREFKCWDTHGQQNLYLAIVHSCNVFFYHTGLLLGAQSIHDYALRFGFGKQTGVDLPYEASGLVPSPLWKKIRKLEGWFDGDTANFSIGQSDTLVTPIQMVRMVAVFANGGFLVRPFIARSIEGQDISVYQRTLQEVHLKEGVLAYVAKSMRGVVSDPEGTANILSIPGLAIAGKTGTVQVPHGQSHAWFAGFFPFNHPKFAICVFIEHGGSGQASCILAKQIIEEMLAKGLLP